jgi:(p)ppGpp synthase/HD superfamily hydrolase
MTRGIEMDRQAQLAIAIQTAANAHAGQFDKGGKPYILHPLHMMNQLLFDTKLATIAVLHDVVEDSDISFVDLTELGMDESVISALKCLTHQEAESYEAYVERICSNHDAIRVKLKDLQHNSCITRLKGIGPTDIARVEKYHKAFMRLTEAKLAFERKS